MIDCTVTDAHFDVRVTLKFLGHFRMVVASLLSPTPRRIARYSRRKQNETEGDRRRQEDNTANTAERQSPNAKQTKSNNRNTIKRFSGLWTLLVAIWSK